MELTDVTIREAAQMPGRSYGVDQRVEAGRALDRLGVSRIQAGFPIVGERERATVKRLAGTTDAEITGLCRAVPGDVDVAVDAGADAVEVFAPVSERHLTHTVERSFDDIVDGLRTAVEAANERGVPVRVTVMDAFRTESERIHRAYRSLPDVRTFGLADTVGVCTPDRVRAKLDAVADAVPRSTLAVHFHDDLGLATANTLVAARAGVGRADVSVASLGERTGNAALEQVVVALALSDDSPPVSESALLPVCREVLAALGEDPDPRDPILGSEATTHEAGLHTAAMLRDPGTFEPFDPERFGGERTLLFGDGTGRDAARGLLERCGREPSPELVETLLERLDDRGPVPLEAALDIAADA